MNISSLTGKTLQNNPLPSKSTPDDKVQGVNKEAPQKPSTTVDINITEISKQILRAFDASSETAPAVDKERVNSIIAALGNGSYSIDAETIAEKIIQMDL